MHSGKALSHLYPSPSLNFKSAWLQIYNLFVATYIVNEIKNFDTLTGGITKVGVINNEGFKELSNDEILMVYNTYRERISNSFDKLANDKDFKKIVDSVFPK